jgi:NarL family two-component system sensor histidine kinase LiaS
MNKEKSPKPFEDYPALTRRIGWRHTAISALAAAVVEGVLWIVLPDASALLHIGLLLAGAGLLTALGIRWEMSTLNRRIAHLDQVTQVWMRGGLSVRVHDRTHDGLGVIADRLDLLVEHLEEDDQDLTRIRASNARLTDQVRALAVVEERNRLARELHDSVKQHLFSLAMTASALRMRLEGLEGMSQELLEMVTEIETSAQEAQHHTTRLIEDLRPASLQERGFVEALNDYTLLFGAQEHLLIYLNVRCDNIQFAPSITEALYRVAQEALHNVARHARATRVDVTLRCTGTRVALTIEDNGIGFDPQQARQGLGLNNMHDRLLEIGGRLQVESQPGIGTTIRAEVEVAPERGQRLMPMSQTQKPNPEAWTWLGQKLVIPVGQSWPWLPADEERHLRSPLIEVDESPLTLKPARRWLSLRKTTLLQGREDRTTHLVLHRDRDRYEWHTPEGNWQIRHIRGLHGRAVLMRNEQPLAAMQYRGRQIDTWTEIVYDDRRYQLRFGKDNHRILHLLDASDIEWLRADAETVRLNQACPRPLLAMVLSRVIEELQVGAVTESAAENQ